jgi:hypothetical protein
VGIIQNWDCVRGAAPPVAVDRREACFDLLRSIDDEPTLEGLTAVRDAVVDYLRTVLGVTLDYGLTCNAPNPFAGSTRWLVTVPRVTSDALIAVYDVRGKRVWETRCEKLATGTNVITWEGRSLDGQRVPAGVYFYKFTAGTYHAAGKLTVLR